MNHEAEYAYLDESAFEKEVLSYHKLVILEFGSDWSGSCRIMAPIVSSISATYGDRIRVVKLDFDLNRHLVDKYGVRTRPTFLFMKNGEVVDHIISSTARNVFEKKLKLLLSRE